MSLAEEMEQTLKRARRNYSELLATTAQLVIAQEARLDSAANAILVLPSRAWTLSQMRRQFETFAKARKYFETTYGIKASSWVILVQRVNNAEGVLIHLGFAMRSEENSDLSLVCAFEPKRV